MNTHSRIVSALMVLFFAIFVCGCRQRRIIIDYAKPPTFSMAEVTGQWIGVNPSYSDLSRLELRADGTGTLTQATTGITNVETMRFEIRRWDIATNNVLTCDFSVNRADALRQGWPVKMTCNVTAARLEALLRNDENGFRENIVFWREKDFDEKLRVLRQ